MHFVIRHTVSERAALFVGLLILSTLSACGGATQDEHSTTSDRDASPGGATMSDASGPDAWPPPEAVGDADVAGGHEDAEPDASGPDASPDASPAPPPPVLPLQCVDEPAALCSVAEGGGSPGWLIEGVSEIAPGVLRWSGVTGNGAYVVPPQPTEDGGLCHCGLGPASRAPKGFVHADLDTTTGEWVGVGLCAVPVVWSTPFEGEMQHRTAILQATNTVTTVPDVLDPTYAISAFDLELAGWRYLSYIHEGASWTSTAPLHTHALVYRWPKEAPLDSEPIPLPYDVCHFEGGTLAASGCSGDPLADGAPANHDSTYAIHYAKGSPAPLDLVASETDELKWYTFFGKLPDRGVSFIRLGGFGIEKHGYLTIEVDGLEPGVYEAGPGQSTAARLWFHPSTDPVGCTPCRSETAVGTGEVTVTLERLDDRARGTFVGRIFGTMIDRSAAGVMIEGSFDVGYSPCPTQQEP
jgi:hypothetical protein